MKAVGNKKKKKSIFLRIALAAFSVYVVIMLIQLQLQISEKQKDIEKGFADLKQLQTGNEDLKKQSEDYEKYLEKKAREQGMARPGETIYIQIPGN